MSRGAPIHPRQRRAAAAALGPRPPSPRPESCSSSGTHLGREHRGTLVLLSPSGTPSRSSSPTPCSISRRRTDPTFWVHGPRAPPPSPLRTWAGGVSRACRGESHLRCPQPGGRGRAGRGRDWSTTEPRPRPPPESDPTFSPARAPPPAPRSLLALSPLAAPPVSRADSHPPARQSRAPCLRPAPACPGPIPPSLLSGKMRLLSEWLLLIFGPWLLKKVRAAGLQREHGGPGCKGPRVLRAR